MATNSKEISSDTAPDTAGVNTLRGWQTRFKRLALIAALLLVVSELCLRMIFGLGAPITYRADPDCGYLPVPSQDVHRFFAWNHINSFGMRSDEVAAQKQPAAIRVLFVGDSVTYGTTHVDQKDIFTSRLGPALTAQLGRPVEVLNASAGGWAVANEVGYLRSRGTFAADLVIFVLNTGDLVQPFNQQPLTLENGYPDQRPLLALSELAWTAKRWVIRRTAAADAGSRTAAENEQRQPGSAATSVTTAPANVDAENVLWALDKAKGICYRANARFAIVYFSSTEPTWQTPLYASAYAELERWVKTANVPLYDCGADLAAYPAADVFREDIHLSPNGHRLAAELIERHWDRLAKP